MDQNKLARTLVARLWALHGESSGAGKALLGWARDYREFLWPGQANAKVVAKKAKRKRTDAAELDWAALEPRARTIELAPPAFAPELSQLCALLGLDEHKRDLLFATVALRRLHPLGNLRARLVAAGGDAGALAAMAAGDAAEQAATAFRTSDAVKLGLVHLSVTHLGGIDLELDWLLSKVLDQGLTDAARITEILAGAPQRASLARNDFERQGEAFDLLLRLLRGALINREAGINILLYGPPGTGKTEFARSLAAALPAPLHATGEADDYGDEPTRLDRLGALRRSQHLLARRGDALILFDEMEDLVGDAQTARDGTTTGPCPLNRVKRM